MIKRQLVLINNDLQKISFILLNGSKKAQQCIFLRKKQKKKMLFDYKTVDD